MLSIEDIEVVYGAAILAVRGVSLSVGQGEIVALLGANGAGKSSTLRAVSNLLPAKRGRLTRGRITFDGRVTTGVPTSRLVSTGLVQVLEGRHCFRALTVEENLITGAIGRQATRPETASDLERVYALFPRLTAKRRTAAGLTSGGEQQMVAIGRALMARPRLLILDEPSMGLAPIVVAEIFRGSDAAQQRRRSLHTARRAERIGGAASRPSGRRAGEWARQARRPCRRTPTPRRYPRRLSRLRQAAFAQPADTAIKEGVV